MEPCTQKGCRYQRVMSPSIVETGKGGDRKKRKPSIKLVEPNMGWDKKKKVSILMTVPYRREKDPVRIRGHYQGYEDNSMETPIVFSTIGTGTAEYLHAKE